MNVINLSLGEPEIAPSRDFVVHAIDAAAAAGVVPGDRRRQPVRPVRVRVDQLARRTRRSRSPSPRRPTRGTIADFSSGGPTPVSLQAQARRERAGRRDHLVAAGRTRPARSARSPGRAWPRPQVAGGAALLMQRHPSWTVAQIKSALVQTGDPVRDERGREVSVLREGGGLINLVRADNPLLFASPTSIIVPGQRRHGPGRR